ncbi:MAG TPA: malonate decarboxylase holo-[acyl-carrier-protein] synthase [Herbaspirillum sp.]|jgi:phosphoribosyl-dephospho-CoA transferase
MSTRPEFSRHDLVWLSGQGWRAACAGMSENCVAILQRWQHEDWPAIVRRTDADANLDGDEVGIGVALPPDAQGQKLRVPLKVPLAGIRVKREPLEVFDVLPAAPLLWQSALRRFADESRACRLDMRVYGSLALQALTRQTYLRDTSDIDILFRPINRMQLDLGMALLARHAQLLPLDGEVLLGGDNAVAWKEWLQCENSEGGGGDERDSDGGDDSERGAHRVLVKRRDGVQLQRVDALLDALDSIGLTDPGACKT